MPTEHMLTLNENELLMELFSLAAIVQTTTSLSRHDTTARFAVNGMLSGPIAGLTCIRQGCPLAPLLFLFMAEILAIALLQSVQIRGLQHSDLPTQEQKFSAFVDDSTVLFTPRGANSGGTGPLCVVLGTLSGLSVQPAKSELIFLNTAVAIFEFEGIPVLHHG